MSRRACPNVHLVEARRDRRLAASDVASIERHVATCATCAEHAADLARIGDALGGEDATITPLEHRRARASLLRAAAAPVAPRVAHRRGVTLLAAAALLITGAAVAAVGVPELLRRDPDPDPSGDAPEPTPSAAEPGPTPSASDPGPTPSASVPGPAPSAVVSLPSPPVLAPVPPEAPPPPSPVASTRATSSPPPRPAPSSPAPRPSTTAPSTPEPAASVAARSRALRDAVEAIERGDYGQASRHLDDARSAETDPERAELASYLQAVALQRAGRLDEARAAARDYLARHPGGRFVREAQRIASGG